MSNATTQQRRYWPRVLRAVQTGDPADVTVYERDTNSFVSELQNACARYDMKAEELRAADEQVKAAQSALAEHVASLNLPIVVEATIYPARQYNLEE